LKAGLWFRRARLVILAPDPRHPRRAQAENPLNDLSKFSRPPLNNVAIQLSMDSATWTTVAERTEPHMVGGLYGVPYRWLAPPGVAARYVRLLLPGTTHLHVDQVEIFGERVDLFFATH